MNTSNKCVSIGWTKKMFDFLWIIGKFSHENKNNLNKKQANFKLSRHRSVEMLRWYIFCFYFSFNLIVSQHEEHREQLHTSANCDVQYL